MYKRLLNDAINSAKTVIQSTCGKFEIPITQKLHASLTEEGADRVAGDREKGKKRREKGEREQEKGEKVGERRRGETARKETKLERLLI